jgi:hypothetical protein
MHEIEDERQDFVLLPLVQPTSEDALIDCSRIKALCSTGFSECPVEDRCVVWFVLLEVFPESPLE